MILTLAQRQTVEAVTQKIFKWEVLVEEQCKILRESDYNQLAQIHAEHAANSLPYGSLPPRDEFDACIRRAELDLQNDPVTVLEHGLI